MSDDDYLDDLEPQQVAIDGTLDLHTFSPRELKTLIPDYLEACLEKGIYSVRIVHGKGTGALRHSVHAILERLPQVEEFGLAGMGGGSWGATLVRLKARRSKLPGIGPEV
jgi:DNA-nicking Smr family endonuclease